MNLATPNKLSDLSTKDVLSVLNNTRSISEAAGKLKVSRQALYGYMEGKIARHCVYIAIGQRDFIAKIIAAPITDQEGQSQ